MRVNKEEILERSRNGGHEEWEASVENHARRLGSLCFTVVLCFLLLINMLKERDNTALFAVLDAYLTGATFGRYMQTRKKGPWYYSGAACDRYNFYADLIRRRDMVKGNG